MNTAVDEFEFFLEKEWSDGLPVVTPTEERIARMLQGTRRDPDEVIGRIPPARSRWPPTSIRFSMWASIAPVFLARK